MPSSYTDDTSADAPGGSRMQLRRTFLAVSFLFASGPGHAQGSSFIGNWQGDVPGIGPARIVITAVGPNGLVQGTMEFELSSFVSTFADKADSVKNTSRGIVSGSSLVIEAALGGKYELTLGGNRLSGIYTRGTTYRADVTFTRT